MVDEDVIEAQGLGVTSTPTTFINGRKVFGAQPLAVFKEIIDEELGVKGRVSRSMGFVLHRTAGW